LVSNWRRLYRARLGADQGRPDGRPPRTYDGGTTDVASHPEFADRKTKRMVDGVDTTIGSLLILRWRKSNLANAIQSRANRDQQYNGLFQIPTFEAKLLHLAKSKSKADWTHYRHLSRIKHSTYHANVKDANNQPFCSAELS